MHFDMKSTLKSNHNYTPKQAIIEFFYFKIEKKLIFIVSIWGNLNVMSGLSRHHI
jgi:hypothetical protein